MKGIVFKQKYISYMTGKLFIDSLINTLDDACVIEYDNKALDSNDWESIEKKLNDNKDADFMYIGIDFGLFKNMKPFHELGVPTVITAGNSWERLKNDQWKKFVYIHKPSIISLDDWCSKPLYEDYLEGEYEYVWKPFDTNLSVIRDYEEDKVIDISLTGKLSYTDRRYYNSYVNIISIKHKLKYKRFNHNYTFEQYARNLNKSWMSLSSVQNNPFYKGLYIGANVPKNIEIAGCKTCLFTRKWGDSEKMGFKDGENCVLFKDNSQIESKLIEYINDKEKLMKISKRGYELVHEEHTPKKHIKQYIKDLKEVLRKI